jgi:predicted  nucleic acid-binding Zn-ribbon protein
MDSIQSGIENIKKNANVAKERLNNIKKESQLHESTENEESLKKTIDEIQIKTEKLRKTVNAAKDSINNIKSSQINNESQTESTLKKTNEKLNITIEKLKKEKQILIQTCKNLQRKLSSEESVVTELKKVFKYDEHSSIKKKMSYESLSSNLRKSLNPFSFSEYDFPSPPSTPRMKSDEPLSDVSFHKNGLRSTPSTPMKKSDEFVLKADKNIHHEMTLLRTNFIRCQK